MEHGGLMLTRKLPAGVYQEDVIIVGGESSCYSSTGNAMKRQKIEVYNKFSFYYMVS